jgi:uncharacterized protein YegP (UPF0339 family)
MHESYKKYLNAQNHMLNLQTNQYEAKNDAI